jgi:hypothetical protein
VPAALLPTNGVIWKSTAPDCATATFASLGADFALKLTISATGAPITVMMQRWSNANRERTFRWQPFGAEVEELGCFDGFSVPTRISAGNHFGTDAYFPFFRAQVTAVRFR